MQKKPRYDVLKLAEIARHPELQPRAAINIPIVEEYRDMLKDGAKFPAVTVFFDRTRYHLADGWHRYAAHEAAGISEIRAEIYEGTFRDAKLYALGANSNHGLPRTNEDKRRAVGMFLNDAEWSTWSDNDIAKACRVSQPFVSKVRNAVTNNVIGDNDSSLTNVPSENADEAVADGWQSVASPRSVGEEVRKKADDIRAAGGEPRFYNNKHGSVGVMDVAKVGRKSASASIDHESAAEIAARTDAIAANPSSCIDADEESSTPEIDEEDIEIDPYAEIESLQKQVAALTSEIDSLTATDTGAEIHKLTQLLFNAEARIDSYEAKLKALKWFGSKFAELRKLLNVKNDRDVITAVKLLKSQVRE